MPDPEATLAMTAATTIVAAMTTSAWQASKTRIAKIFHRSDDSDSGPDSGADIENRLERSAERIASATDPDDVRQKQIVRWQEDLADLIREHPDVSAELRTLVRTLQQELPPVQQQWIQRIEARDGGRAFGVQGTGSKLVFHQDEEDPPAGGGR